MANTKEEEMYFFIADISGYTAYLIKNSKDYDHGTVIVNQLIKCLIKEVQMPLEISKLEGDAIFLFLRSEKVPQEIRDNPASIGEKILQFFMAFSAKLKELQESRICGCGACTNIDKLNLKMIVHYGKASIESIGNFQELSGVDVIIAHRLLKNKAQKKRYVLMTSSAKSRVTLPQEAKMEQWEEQDKDIGSIPVHVFYLPMDESPATGKQPLLKKLMYKWNLNIDHALKKCGLKKKPHLHNLPENDQKSA